MSSDKTHRYLEQHPGLIRRLESALNHAISIDAADPYESIAESLGVLAAFRHRMEFLQGEYQRVVSLVQGVLEIPGDLTLAPPDELTRVSPRKTKPLTRWSSPELPQHLMLVSDDITAPTSFIAAVNKNTEVLEFSHAESTAADLSHSVNAAVEARGGARYDTVALVTHGDADPSDTLLWPITSKLVVSVTPEAKVTAGDLLACKDPALAGFQQVASSLANAVTKDGRVDLFGCDLVKDDAGKALLQAAEEMTGKNWAASNDTTGNESRGGDWVLESDNVDVVSTYFEAAKIRAYEGVFSTADALKRIQKELQDLAGRDRSEWMAEPIREDLRMWQARVTGPKGSPYQGGVFDLSIHFPHNYPHSPPKVKFSTSLYHLLVDCERGTICLDLLKDKWSPTYTIATVLNSIVAMLKSPDIHSAVDAAIAEQFVANREEYNARAKRWTQKACEAIDVQELTISNILQG